MSFETLLLRNCIQSHRFLFIRLETKECQLLLRKRAPAWIALNFPGAGINNDKSLLFAKDI